MHNEQFYPFHLDFNMSSYQRDENGLVANIEDARLIIRNLYQIIQFLEASAFEHLPVSTQSEIALYLVGTYLLTHNSSLHDFQYQEKIALLESIFNQKFNELIQQSKETLNSQEILKSVEEMFKDFGKEL